MSEVFQNKKALYHYSPTLFLSVTTRSSAVVSDVTYLDSRSCQNLVGLDIASVALWKFYYKLMNNELPDYFSSMKPVPIATKYEILHFIRLP